MRRIVTAALLAAPLLLVGSSRASAQHPCNYGYGCGGVCLRLFPHIHQHGPLFNYGPYYGYPPFEPYGYWNPYLQYTGPVGPTQMAAGGGYEYGHKVKTGNPNPLFPGGFGGLFHHRKASGCSSCGTVAGAVIGDPVERYSGTGNAAASAAYYSGTPELSVTPVAGFRYW